MSEYIGTVLVKSPENVWFEGEYRVPATAVEVYALTRGTEAEKEAATEALVERLFGAFKHVLLYGAHSNPWVAWGAEPAEEEGA